MIEGTTVGCWGPPLHCGVLWAPLTLWGVVGPPLHCGVLWAPPYTVGCCAPLTLLGVGAPLTLWGVVGPPYTVVIHSCSSPYRSYYTTNGRCGTELSLLVQIILICNILIKYLIMLIGLSNHFNAL